MYVSKHFNVDIPYSYASKLFAATPHPQNLFLQYPSSCDPPIWLTIVAGATSKASAYQNSIYISCVSQLNYIPSPVLHFTTLTILHALYQSRSTGPVGYSGEYFDLQLADISLEASPRKFWCSTLN